MGKNSSGLQIMGKVIRVMGGNYQVQLDGMDMIITATLTGKMRQKKINVILGETVRVEINEYEPSKGMIIWRGEKMGEFNKNNPRPATTNRS